MGWPIVCCPLLQSYCHAIILLTKLNSKNMESGEKQPTIENIGAEAKAEVGGSDKKNKPELEAALNNAEVEMNAAIEAAANLPSEDGETMSPEQEALQKTLDAAIEKYNALEDKLDTINADILALEAGGSTEAANTETENPTEPTEATVEKEGNSDKDKEIRQKEYMQQMIAEWKKTRPEIVAKLQAEGKIPTIEEARKTGESTDTIPNKEYSQIVNQGYDERMQEGQVAEAVMFESFMRKGGGEDLDSRIANLDPKIFSEKLPELQQSLLTTEQQQNLDDHLVRAYAKASKLKSEGSSGRLENDKINALNNIEQNPAKIDTFTAKISKEMPTAESAQNEGLVSAIINKGREDKKFAKEVKEYAKSVGMGKENDKGGTDFSTTEILNLAKHFEKELLPTAENKKGAEIRAARQHFEKAQNYFSHNQETLTDLGKKGEEALGAVIENYLDAQLDYMKQEPESRGKDEKLSYAGFLNQIQESAGNISDAATKQRISEKLIDMGLVLEKKYH